MASPVVFVSFCLHWKRNRSNIEWQIKKIYTWKIRAERIILPKFLNAAFFPYPYQGAVVVVVTSVAEEVVAYPWVELEEETGSRPSWGRRKSTLLVVCGLMEEKPNNIYACELVEGTFCKSCNVFAEKRHCITRRSSSHTSYLSILVHHCII